MSAYEFTTDWSANWRDYWPRLFAPYVGKPGLRFLEIGSFEGRSACWLLDNVLTGEGSHLTCVDTWQDLDVFRRHVANLAPFVRTGRCLAERMDLGRFVCSRACFDDSVADDVDYRSFDVIYIDGSHLAPDVLSDAVLSWRLLKVGGLLIFDDYHWTPDEPGEQGPRVAIDAFLACMRGRFELVAKGAQVAVRKVR